jgi:hypothetical protein
MDDTADDPIDVPGVPRDDPVEDSTDDLSDDLTDDPTDNPTDDSTDDPIDVLDVVPSVVPADDSIVDLSSMDLDVPAVVPTVIPSDDSADDPTDDPAYLILSTKLDDPFAEGRQDRAAMTTSAARLVSVRISSASLAIVSESRRAPKSRRAFSQRSARTSSGDPSTACVFTDKSDIVVVSNVSVVSRRRSFASSSRDRSRSATCARSASFSARHDSSSSAASVLASALGSDDALPATDLCLRKGKGSLRISTML